MAVITPIRRPGVEVFQEFVTPSPTLGSPSLVPCIVGPGYQIVDVLDTTGSLSTDALATGTYRDTVGDLEFAIPGVVLGAIVEEATVDVRLVYGSQQVQLNPDSEEVVVLFRAALGGIINGASAFTDAGFDFAAAGVLAGDQIEFTVGGVVHRLLIETVVVGNLTVYYTWTLTTVALSDYTIYRNGADYEVDLDPAAASLAVGSSALYTDLTVTAVTPGPDGNDISLEIVNPAQVSFQVGNIGQVTVTGNSILVQLETNGAGALVPTAEEVLRLLNGSAYLDSNDASNPFDQGGAHNANSEIRFRAVPAGAGGDAIEVRFASAVQATAVAYDAVNDRVTVTFNAGGAVRARDICDAINSDPAASLRIQAYPAPVGLADGSGIVNWFNLAAVQLDTANAGTVTQAAALILASTTAGFGVLSGGVWVSPAAGSAPTIPVTSLAGGVSRANTVTIYQDRLNATAVASVYIGYHALRVDLSAAASTAGTGNEPELTVVNSTAEIEDLLGVIHPDNPLAFGASLALANSPTSLVACLGVSAVTSQAPEGTQVAYQEAFDFLETREVYGIVPLTQAPAVHSILRTHVLAMSAPEEKGERVGIVNQGNPTNLPNTTVTSGTAATGSGGPPLNTVTQTQVDFILEGVLVGDVFVIATATGPYTLPNGGGTGWLVSGSITPGSLVVTATVQALPASPYGTWSIVRAGAVIATSQQRAQAVGEIGLGFASRRFVHVVPYRTEVSVDGVAQLLAGYYIACGVAGLCGDQPPERGFTNLPMAGYLGVRGSNDAFSSSQLNLIAGGGNYVVVQEGSGAPLTARHALTTDTSTVEFREFNITRQLDYAAKFFRRAVSPYVGVFVIDDLFIENLGVILQGACRWLVRHGHLRGARLLQLRQDTVSPDTMIATIEIEVLYPGNYIQIHLQV